MDSRFQPSVLPLVIWGASGHARVVADILRLNGQYAIAGFIDDIEPAKYGTEFCGARVLGGHEQLASLLEDGIRHILVAIGDCRARLEMWRVAADHGFQLASAIHPRAVVSGDSTIGAGSVIVAGAVVNPGSRLGENVIVNTSASVGHNCTIADGAHVGPGARLGGGVAIGRASWIGIGATLKDKITIGSNAIVGAGAVVLRDVPDGVVAFGVPARVIRKNIP